MDRKNISYRVFISEDAFLEKERLKNNGTSSEPSFLLTGIFCWCVFSYIKDRISYYEFMNNYFQLFCFCISRLRPCYAVQVVFDGSVWVWNKANHFSFVLSMDATMKADIKPLKSFLWISVSKCFDIYKPK